PITYPAPIIEFRFMSELKADAFIAAYEFKQKPFLFLSHTHWFVVMANHTLGQAVP
ncbi:dinucleoside polyphosphate hydrolase [Oceanobacter sp. RED65]|nr:dinucleoside polyphosphate hydrolase [Oceanobacter sp. RED65] [Bermanella marisrubri]